MKKQPNPKKNKNKSICNMVIKDMKDRKLLGLKRYGVVLQAFNTRNSLQDCYEEELDKIFYMKQWMIEKKEIIKVLKFYSNLSNGLKAKNILKKLNEL